MLMSRSKPKHQGTNFTQLCNDRPLGGKAYGSLILCQEAKSLHGEYVMHCQLRKDLLPRVSQLMEVVIYVDTQVQSLIF